MCIRDSFSIVFNIYGGSNQILPNATSATQNYYGDEAELEKDDVSTVSYTHLTNRPTWIIIASCALITKVWQSIWQKTM